jgi:hypothetical protein
LSERAHLIVLDDETLFVFADINAYWEAARRGPPAGWKTTPLRAAPMKHPVPRRGAYTLEELRDLVAAAERREGLRSSTMANGGSGLSRLA